MAATVNSNNNSSRSSSSGSKSPHKWLSSMSRSFNRLRPRSKSLTRPGSPLSPLSPTKGSITRRDYSDEFKEVFRYFDANGDGKISALELRSYFGSLEEYMSHEEAENVINALDSDGDCLLDYQDFVRLMKRGSSRGDDEDDSLDDGEDEDEDLKRAFEMYEMEKGSGCITPKGLQKMLRRLGDEKTYDECVAMIGYYDIDGNGVLDYQEFHRMMAY